MTRLLRLSVCLTLGACAATARNVPSPVAANSSAWSEARLRDTDGNPLPAYAIEDTSLPLLQIWCADGNDYHIALDRDGRFYTAANWSIYRVTQPGSDQTMCNRILSYRR